MTHPAADLETERAAVTVQRRLTVPFTTWLSDLVRHCGQTERALYVVTPPNARLTRPLGMVMRAPFSHWVVRDVDGHFDALSGRPLTWDGTTFVELEKEARSAADGPESSTLGTVLTLAMTVSHPSAERMVIGLAAEHLTRTLSGTTPTGWGAAEPLTRPWSRREITALCEQCGERSAWLFFHAGPAGGASRTVFGSVRTLPHESQVQELVELVIGYEPGDEPPLDQLGEIVGRATAQFPLESLLALRQEGSPDLTVTPYQTGSAVPVGLAIGPEPLRRVGRGHAFDSPDLAVQVIGGTAPSAWYPLGDGRSAAGHDRLRRLVEHLT
jgi:Family of unknown function (DUF6177)